MAAELVLSAPRCSEEQPGQIRYCSAWTPEKVWRPSRTIHSCEVLDLHRRSHHMCHSRARLCVIAARSFVRFNWNNCRDCLYRIHFVSHQCTFWKQLQSWCAWPGSWGSPSHVGGESTSVRFLHGAGLGFHSSLQKCFLLGRVSGKEQLRITTWFRFARALLRCYGRLFLMKDSSVQRAFWSGQVCRVDLLAVRRQWFGRRRKPLFDSSWGQSVSLSMTVSRPPWPTDLPWICPQCRTSPV